MNEASAEPREAYDAFAASYEEFNARYQYRGWTETLLATAVAEGGLSGKRLLDVGCGTGLSFVVPLERGFSVTGCDISPAMLAKARARADERVRLVEADMRSLPFLGEFDLIWSVNDALNYLMDEEELTDTLRGMRSNLAPGGVIVFDLNTLAGYGGFWSERVVVEGKGGRSFVWNGLAEDVRPGGIFEASFEGTGEGVARHRHRQRHFPVARVLAAAATTGLRAVAVLGERDGELGYGVDENLHTKAVYVCKGSPGDRRRAA